MADSTPETWRRVDDYLAATLLDDDTALAQAQSDSLAAGLPSIEVTPLAGKLLYLLARMTGARRVLGWARSAATRRSGSPAASPAMVAS